MVSIFRPSDFHVHLREGSILNHSLNENLKHFQRILIMPNLSNPITNSKIFRHSNYYAWIRRTNKKTSKQLSAHLISLNSGNAFWNLINCQLSKIQHEKRLVFIPALRTANETTLPDFISPGKQWNNSPPYWPFQSINQSSMPHAAKKFSGLLLLLFVLPLGLSSAFYICTSSVAWHSIYQNPCRIKKPNKLRTMNSNNVYLSAYRNKLNIGAWYSCTSHSRTYNYNNK